jgi:threonine/homoserine/homoserine lactone efflux protein
MGREAASASVAGITTGTVAYVVSVTVTSSPSRLSSAAFDGSQVGAAYLFCSA